MRNRHMPAKPIFSGDDAYPQTMLMNNESCNGLTKLEYAAIQIMAGNQSIPGTHNRPKTASFDAVEKANALFDELEKQENKS